MLTVLTLALACQRAATPPPEAAPTAHLETTGLQPEQATGCRDAVPVVESQGGLVVAAHPEAARIGAEILGAGGTAVDAAVAVAVALTLVEPQSSGIGGGAFALHHDGETGLLTAWDGRETAPAAAGADLFVGDGARLSWLEAVPSGRSVGTPGLLRLLEAMHAQDGALPWAQLITPTIALAEEGFTVTPRLSQSLVELERITDAIRRNPAARALYYPGDRPVQPGQRLQNPQLAATLRVVAESGADALYEGPLAEQIVAAVQAADPPGALSLADLATYRAVQREPVCLDFRAHQVCGHPPPTSGGVTVLQILGLLGPPAASPDDPAGLHRFIEASRLAWADRDRYLADPDAVSIPTQALLDPAYLAARAAEILPDQRLSEVTPGELPLPAPPDGPICPEGNDTTHFVVVDGTGDVVSLTSSVEMAFGSGILVGGFLLNNQLTDFAFDPQGPHGPVANRPGPCKRPRSSMAPTIVYDTDGQVVLALGSPGGSRIISYVARALVDTLDHGLTLQEAVSRPHLVGSGSAVELEQDCGTPPWPASTADALGALGHTVRWTSLNSGLHGIERTEAGWRSAVDPRREGAARAVAPPPPSEESN